MKNEDFIIGNIISMENDFLEVKVQKSVLKIYLNDVARIEYSPEYKDTNFEKRKFFSGREKLTKVYQTLTGNTLGEGEINISFIDYEFGITDNFQISSDWIRYFEKDLNFSPKLKLVDMRTQNIRHQLSIGGTYLSNYDGRYKQESSWDGDYEYSDVKIILDEKDKIQITDKGWNKKDEICLEDINLDKGEKIYIVIEKNVDNTLNGWRAIYFNSEVIYY